MKRDMCIAWYGSGKGGNGDLWWRKQDGEGQRWGGHWPWTRGIKKSGGEKPYEKSGGERKAKGSILVRWRRKKRDLKRERESW